MKTENEVKKIADAYVPCPKGTGVYAYLRLTRPFDTEKLAAIFVDKYLIGRGKEPVNILKRK
jgi:hypothetical protein